ncbi:hypothetical protein HerbRD11066_67620 [Herbidospora sp. RD11066]
MENQLNATGPTSGGALNGSLDRTSEVRFLAQSRSIRQIPGWCAFVSDAGRFWATRLTAFSNEELAAGAERTVDADDHGELTAAIAAQEECAAQARRQFDASSPSPYL